MKKRILLFLAAVVVFLFALAAVMVGRSYGQAFPSRHLEQGDEGGGPSCATCIATARYDSALRACALEAELGIAPYSAWINRGIAWIHLGNSVDAEKDFSRAVAMDNHSVAGYAYRGIGDTDTACLWFRRAMATGVHAPAAKLVTERARRTLKESACYRDLVGALGR